LTRWTRRERDKEDGGEKEDGGHVGWTRRAADGEETRGEKEDGGHVDTLDET